mmetsp:Transcript_32429/g.39249  ORF Transcript_32429/g.39249 Transcript_32429/m.39249 type:complete len:397 (+) Transcript_32429:388-1578(+)|eukprot:CAMPEP_0197850628 /NCGR_PEP_ID=MMETSP1438-20131217/15929_1 /TAXON_ID=1461541 /ORGANISM="Pterosperma sp., Strain CCMP1384" /LENGTH=396 /DNA_ID=CAMNT_0043463897 /DNA_START=388 /DNA_END=1578 /DNA_ORIENTATION=-
MGTLSEKDAALVSFEELARRVVEHKYEFNNGEKRLTYKLRSSYISDYLQGGLFAGWLCNSFVRSAQQQIELPKMINKFPMAVSGLRWSVAGYVGLTVGGYVAKTGLCSRYIELMLQSDSPLAGESIAILEEKAPHSPMLDRAFNAHTSGMTPGKAPMIPRITPGTSVDPFKIGMSRESATSTAGMNMKEDLSEGQGAAGRENVRTPQLLLALSDISRPTLDELSTKSQGIAPATAAGGALDRSRATDGAPPPAGGGIQVVSPTMKFNTYVAGRESNATDSSAGGSLDTVLSSGSLNLEKGNSPEGKKEAASTEEDIDIFAMGEWESTLFSEADIMFFDEDPILEPRKAATHRGREKERRREKKEKMRKMGEAARNRRAAETFETWKDGGLMKMQYD